MSEETMIGPLEKAFAEASRLPAKEQDWLAQFIMEEIAVERRWDALFSRSGRALDDLIAEALAEDEAAGQRPSAGTSVITDSDFRH
jgi:hypothetical protein